MMTYELLPCLDFSALLKLCLLCRESYYLISHGSHFQKLLELNLFGDQKIPKEISMVDSITSYGKCLKNVMIHETEVSDGFCYKRYNQDFERTEYLAFSGYGGPHTDNPSYFTRVVA